MLFNSYPFLFVYLPLTLLGFYLFASLRWLTAAKGWLLIASLLFYGYWDVRFVPLLMASILFNFWAGNWLLKLTDVRKKRALFLFSLAADLSLLFYFKYVNFFLSTFSKLSGQAPHLIEMALPLGISFFTFTQIAYLVDLYRGHAGKSHLINYGLFVTLFPHLIAGPILHHKEMMDQFEDEGILKFKIKNMAEGLFLFTLGLFKKVAIADYLSSFVAPIFDAPIVGLTLIPAWFGAICYSLQLYFDFSGYSDMAVGLGLLFNMKLPINFNSPYQADSIIDFWRRWHMTLSRFLKDYLYIPLGGNRGGESGKLRNLFLTMLLGGLWHGAGWTFVAWGACHGFYLIVNHAWRKLSIPLPNLLSRFATLLAATLAWVIFRSPSISTAKGILASMFALKGVALPIALQNTLAHLSSWGISFIHFSQHNLHAYDFLFVFLFAIVVLKTPNSNYWCDRFLAKPKTMGVLAGVMSVIALLNLEKISEFLYYQF